MGIVPPLRMDIWSVCGVADILSLADLEKRCAFQGICVSWDLALGTVRKGIYIVSCQEGPTYEWTATKFPARVVAR